ncbi:unnamed protein product [Durusdinium trenchii]|uniref:Uncharacterized protein n=1 Tax=Durusdinium trenchii TaxID=1381693 RepID=A0ABP0LXI8_9DINO
MGGKTTGEQVDVPEPPKPLSDGAIRSRLNRLLKRRANGSSLVPEEVLVDWESEDTRNTIKKMFEKAGYDKELFIRKVKRVYQEISENSFETNWEFLSVEDMKEKGWKSIYGEGWLYWTLVSTKGQQKKLGFADQASACFA